MLDFIVKHMIAAWQVNDADAFEDWADAYYEELDLLGVEA